MPKRSATGKAVKKAAGVGDDLIGEGVEAVARSFTNDQAGSAGHLVKDLVAEHFFGADNDAIGDWKRHGRATLGHPDREEPQGGEEGCPDGCMAGPLVKSTADNCKPCDPDQDVPGASGELKSATKKKRVFEAKILFVKGPRAGQEGYVALDSSETDGYYTTQEIIDLLKTISDDSENQELYILSEIDDDGFKKQLEKLFKDKDISTTPFSTADFEALKSEAEAVKSPGNQNKKYIAVKRTKITEELNYESKQVGHLEKNTEIEAISEEKRDAKGRLRVQISSGWVTIKNRDGEELLKPVDADQRSEAVTSQGNQNKTYIAVKRTKITEELNYESKQVGHLEKNTEIEAISGEKRDAEGRDRVQTERGWVTIKNKQGEELLKPVDADQRSAASESPDLAPITDSPLPRTWSGDATPAAPATDASQQQLLLELRGLRMFSLRKRAKEAGASPDSVDAATDGDDPKDALIDLIVRQQSGQAQGGPTAPPKAPGLGATAGRSLLGASLGARPPPPKAPGAGPPATPGSSGPEKMRGGGGITMGSGATEGVLFGLPENFIPSDGTSSPFINRLEEWGGENLELFLKDKASDIKLLDGTIVSLMKSTDIRDLKKKIEEAKEKAKLLGKNFAISGPGSFGDRAQTALGSALNHPGADAVAGAAGPAALGALAAARVVRDLVSEGAGKGDNPGGGGSKKNKKKTRKKNKRKTSKRKNIKKKNIKKKTFRKKYKMKKYSLSLSSSSIKKNKRSKKKRSKKKKKTKRK